MVRSAVLLLSVLAGARGQPFCNDALLAVSAPLQTVVRHEARRIPTPPHHLSIALAHSLTRLLLCVPAVLRRRGVLPRRCADELQRSLRSHLGPLRCVSNLSLSHSFPHTKLTRPLGAVEECTAFLEETFGAQFSEFTASCLDISFGTAAPCDAAFEASGRLDVRSACCGGGACALCLCICLFLCLGLSVSLPLPLTRPLVMPLHL